MQRVMYKIPGSKYKIGGGIEIDHDQIHLYFDFNRALLDEVKTTFEPRKWNPTYKRWTVENNERNMWALTYLVTNTDPYDKYPRDFQRFETDRKAYDHQKDMAGFILSRPASIIAGEMGTGKTLAVLMAIEHLIKQGEFRADQVVYVGPKSGVVAYSRELDKWGFQFDTLKYTYETLTKVVYNVTMIEPKFVIFDESQRIKTPTAQRSKAAMELARAVRRFNGRVVLMTGTPAPKTPLDWWYQCEVAQPGYVREGNIHSFTRRLALLSEQETPSGVTYNKIESWLDDENKCAVCGKMIDAHKEADHVYKKSFNQVAAMYKRLGGLVLVKFKKDCLDLPPFVFDVIKVKPTADTVRAAKIIQKSGAGAAHILTRLRELSDGFQYANEIIDHQQCEVCGGTGEIHQPVLIEEHDILKQETFEHTLEPSVCPTCGGTKQVPVYKQSTINFETPKDQALFDQLDAHEDIGRICVFGGFRATIDKLVTMCRSKGWYVLCVDGRGYRGFDPDGASIGTKDLLDAMDFSSPRFKELEDIYPQVAFVGQASSGGMALTLTASPSIVFYSNTYDGMARMQAEHRIHRAGMRDIESVNIIDLHHLGVDALVLKNLKEKKRLQDITMGDIDAAMEDE